MSILRAWFGPSKDEVWRQLAAEIGAEMVDGGFWRGNKVQAAAGPWTITLDTYAVSTGKSTIVYTRMRAPYVNHDGLRFTIYRRGLFSDLAKLLGAQDIEVGEPAFDEAFMIKGTDEERVRQLFGDPTIQHLLLAQPDGRLSVQDDEGWFGASFPEGVDELQFLVVGVVKDIDRLKALYELFATVLDRLCAIGSAYRSDPEVRL